MPRSCGSAEVIQLRMEQFFLDYPGGPNVITKALIGEQIRQETQGEIGRCYIDVFKNGGRGYEPKNIGSLQNLEKVPE